MRLALLISLAATMLALASPVPAAEVLSFEEAAFDSAQAAGRRIVVHVTAPWCITCKAQKPTVEALVADPANDDLVLFDVDFDSRKDVLRRFDVRQQASFVAFVGTRETARAVGVVDPAAIAALFASTRGP